MGCFLFVCLYFGAQTFNILPLYLKIACLLLFLSDDCPEFGSVNLMNQESSDEIDTTANAKVFSHSNYFLNFKSFPW